MDKGLRELIESQEERAKLYKRVFNTKDGELLLKLMKVFYPVVVDTNNNNETYYRMGQHKVIIDIGFNLNYQPKEK